MTTTRAQDHTDHAVDSLHLAIGATLPGRASLENPSDVYQIIGHVLAMTQAMPQLLAQLSAWLVAEHHAGRVGDDAGLGPGFRISRVKDALESATVRARTLENTLNWAHTEASHLTGQDSSEEPAP